MVEALDLPTAIQPSKQVDNNLDALLERYLQLLDQYQNLQRSLSDFLSKGHLLLAQANFSSANRVRHGQEHYDGRMQALNRVFINESSPYFSITKLIVQKSDLASDGNGANVEVDTIEDFALTGKGPPPSINTETRSSVTRDPLYWFGVLVPSALKASQMSFKDAVADVIPALASTSKEMKEVEIEVRRIRKRMSKAF